MSWLARVMRVFHESKLDRDLADEQRFHMEARKEDLIRRGMSADEAALAAQRRFGNPLQLREHSREARLVPWLESVVHDIQFGIRMLGKNPTVTLAAVISLALAIGASTAAFSLIEALILRPLPVTDAPRLVYVSYPSESPDAEQRGEDADSFSYPLFRQMRDAALPLADMFAVGYQSEQSAIFNGTGGRVEKFIPQWISGNSFEVLGIRPALGRLLSANDDLHPGAHPVAVLSYDFWQRRFGGDPHVVGQWFTREDNSVQGEPFQIVGVAQAGFTGLEPGYRTDVWMPTMMFTEAIDKAGWSWLRIWGRLKPGIAADQLRSNIQGPFTADRRERVAKYFPADTPPEQLRLFLNSPVHVASAAHGPSQLRKNFERPLWILAGVVGLVLLIACFNVANLYLARVTARDHEMALRISIGAGRRRLIQQLLIESGLIALAASILGAMFAVTTAPVVVSLLSTTDTHIFLDLRPNASVFAFLVLICTVTTLLFGLAPALRASRTTPNTALKAGSGKSSTRIGLLRPLLAIQVGFGFVVLFVAGLLLFTFQRLNHVDPGFAKEGVILCRVEAKGLREGGEKARVAWQQLLDRVGQLNGIQSASASSWALFRGWGWSDLVRVPGRKPDDYEPSYLSVSPRFLATMRIRLIAGRDFTPHDAEPETPTTVIVNQAFVRRYYPDKDPVGQQFTRQGSNKTWVPQVIAGVAGDAKYNDLRGAPPPTVYVPYRGEDGSGTLEVRTSLDPSSVSTLLRNEIPRVHAGFNLTEVNLQSAYINNQLTRERLMALLSGFFALVAITLVALGLYGVLNYAVIQRTREIGIRVALGAQQGQAIRLVLSSIGLAVVVGLAVGVGIGLGMGKLLTDVLFEVQPSDFAGIALPLGCLLLASIVAALPAAIRASKVDPSIALRYE
ncbi:MAG: ABC transporter permease [Bryobacteraceae bacterium]